MLAYCRRKPVEEHFQSLTNDYRAPKNIEKLQTPRTNPDIWELLNKGVRIVDTTTQRSQSLQVSALSVLMRIIDQIGGDTAGACVDHLQEVSDAVAMLVMSFAYLSQSRKELIRNALGFPLAKFCTWDTPVGADLIPELPKKLKERDEARLNLRKRNNFNR